MKRNTGNGKTPRTVPNLASLARLENVSRATTTRWNRDGAVSWDGDRIDVQATRRLVKELAGPTKDPRLAEARLKILKAEAALRELKLQQRKGELVEASEVEADLLTAFSSLTTIHYSVIPWISATLLSMDKAKDSDFRKLCIGISDRVEEAFYSAYVNSRLRLGELAGESRRKTLRAAAAVWKLNFGSRWEDWSSMQIETLQRAAEETRSRPVIGDPNPSISNTSSSGADPAGAVAPGRGTGGAGAPPNQKNNREGEKP
ncbi:hypothetical protein K0B90_03145 [bacterium]|nr:hypothetical protein [bacterium]